VIAERGELCRGGAEHGQSERVLQGRDRRRHIGHGKADLTDAQHPAHGVPGAVVVGWGGQTILITAGEWAEPMITSDRRSRMLLSWDIERGEPVVAELVKN
jgi:hypothetical protein